MLERFALLRVKSVQPMGCFLEGDLYLPSREQTEELEEGADVIVYVLLDLSRRPIATMKLDEHFDRDTSRLRPRQKVSLLIFAETDLGFQAIIDERFLGMLYRNEVFEELGYGSRRTGMVRRVREDGKVDLVLTTDRDELAERILEALEEAGGHLPLTDRSDPAEITRALGVSKKQFKMAVGGLFKRRLVVLDEDGLRLAD